jgi:glycosyltransferase involved in cell wall biosynthesis
MPKPIFKNSFKKIHRLMQALNFSIWKASGGKEHKPTKVVYVQDGDGWVIQRVGNYLSQGVRSENIDFSIADSSRFLKNKLLHFGSLHTFAGAGLTKTDKSNRVVVTVYHGDLGISQEFDDSIGSLVKNRDRIDWIVTSTETMRKRLINWGISPQKVSVIPIGVELSAFHPLSTSERKNLRSELGIPENAICIGSFQKDGNGWGEGLEPKLVKGPDIFVECLIRLSKKWKVHCLLTGPSRGYVKKRLEEAGIAYSHRLFDSYSEVARTYHCLDLYLVTSREEGGPMSIMESMVSGVPLVSTRVGMAPDIIRHRENGMLADIEDIGGIIEAAEELLSNPPLKEKCLSQAKLDVQSLDWQEIGLTYAKLYRKILSK